MNNKKSTVFSIPSYAAFLILFVFFGIILNITLNAFDVSLIDKLTIATAFVFVSYCYIFAILLKLYRQISFLFIFILLSIPFSYGQHFVAIFDYDYLRYYQNFHILDGRLADSSIINATFMIIIFLLLLTFGYIMVNDRYKNDFSEAVIEKPTKENTKHYSIYSLVAIIFLIISIYPAFKEVYAQYSLSQQFGYLMRRQIENQWNYHEILGVSLREIYIADWFLPAIYMLIMSISKKRLRWIPYSILMVYSMIYMLTGSRFTLIKIFLNIFLIEYLWHKSIKKKHLKYLPIVLFPLIIVLGILTNLRGSAGYSIQSIADSVFDYLTGRPFSSIFWETGITFTTVSNVIDKVPSVLPFFNGKSFIGAIIICLPDFLRFGFTDTYTLTISSSLSPLYYNTNNFGYGSSIYAEQFYNFGYLYFIFAGLIGSGIGFLEKKLLESNAKRKIATFLTISFILGELLYSVRNDLYAIPRLALFSLGIPLFTIFILKIVNRSLKR
ncbi:O-antigen polysaccharide polymerase Wzy family protein [Streptococcus sp. CSL10205-OR2]|uniref:O-antigen polysaccharide polymerase Wzy family protein n=1 Tax=Streptococcus sp. CSL10205-OR2 TaxID=2980558 RepID=UPI0021D831E7|nr:O-antigen polysaccharide polymerase Wzy family protein [Streptococcus sp. CSL10205-OR2]MCU9533612.1 O-antigen polysaccharide polymerase Wzy family protein [Streptococcus sp. CSL10205-OR2]